MGAPSQEHNWLALSALSLIAIVTGLGIGDAWRAPFSPDEGMYYLPAIRAYAGALPHISINPPFPGPPTGLLLQALVFRAFNNSWLAVRLFSAIGIIGLIGILYVYLRRFGKSFHEGSLLLLAGAHPFVVYHAFVFKQHALMLFLLMAALVLWQSKPTRFRIVVSSLLLILAVTTNQLVAAICPCLALEAYRSRVRNRQWLAQALAAIAPIAVLAMFVIAWKGTIPPAYRSQPIVTRVKFGTIYPSQIFASFLTLGVWLAPSVDLSRKSLVRSIMLAIPFGLGLYIWNGYDPSVGFPTTIVGPISSVLRSLATWSRAISSAVGGLVCGFGAELLWRVGFMGSNGMNLVVLVASYTAMMMLVPYQFECYYVVLFLAAWLVLSNDMLRARPTWITESHRVFVALTGFVYVVYKVSGILSS